MQAVVCIGVVGLITCVLRTLHGMVEKQIVKLCNVVISLMNFERVLINFDHCGQRREYASVESGFQLLRQDPCVQTGQWFKAVRINE